jgi:hypothetical protein
VNCSSAGQRSGFDRRRILGGGGKRLAVGVRQERRLADAASKLVFLVADSETRSLRIRNP